jgi:hypothetical protein
MLNNNQMEQSIDLLSTGAPMTMDTGLVAVGTTLAAINHQLLQQQARLKDLEHKVAQLQYRQQIPDLGLLSDSFLKRAFSVFGYWVVAYLLIVVPLFVLATLLGG